MTVSPLCLTDLDEITKFFSFFPDGWNKSMIESGFLSGRLRVLKAVDCGKVVGMISFSLGVDDADIEDVFVIEEFRRRGVASTLIKEAEKVCKKEEKSRLLLEVRKSNFAAIRLYLSLGFKKISERKKYYGDEDAEIFLKEFK